MKRHPALQQLSRDHHRALVAAQRLKRAGDSGAKEARARFLEYWDADGNAHFREEEEFLLPAVAGFIDAEEPVIARVLVDHVRIRHLAAKLAGDWDLASLRALGSQLEQHVRLEDRELFPLIERTMPETQLVALAERLAPSSSDGGPIAP
jgi:hemerythrin-like domain-containing protein